MFEDHIAPWHSCYQSTQLLKGDTTFVLGQSGHVSGVINPPSKKKYGYYSSDKKGYPEESQEWFKTTTLNEGSWWEHWHQWQKTRSGASIDAKIDTKDASLPKAPGSYVLTR